MYNIIDYLKYYKDCSLEENHWNRIDNLLCALLVYLPIKPFKKEKTLLDFYNYAKEYNKPTKEILTPYCFQILEMIKESKRYKNLKISNFDIILDEKTQFGAATFRVKNKTIVSFKGSDGAFIGWVENLRIIYEYPTYTQELAIAYLKRNIKFQDQNVLVVGHSKGGNLAMASVMELPPRQFKKVKKIYNFDGPGFREKEFTSEKFQKIEPILENILPTGSLVGVLLNNTKYHVIKSKDIAINEHYPINWNIFGEFFVPGKLSMVSSNVHKSTSVELAKLDNQKVKATVEALFQIFDLNYDSTFEINFTNITKIIKFVRKIDPEFASYLTTLLLPRKVNKKEAKKD